MKRTRIARVSKKHAKELREYAALYHKLKELCRRDDGEYYSELDGRKKSFWSCGELCPGLDCHHIDGKQNARLIDPFNIICIGQGGEHSAETAHHSFERIQELKALVRPIRLAQGFVEIP